MDSITQGTSNVSNKNPIFLAIMGIGAFLVAGLLIWLLLTPSQKVDTTPKLEGALREGPQFEELKRKIVVDKNQDFTTESRSLAGGLQMRLVAVVRNFTGKSLTGLEVVGTVIDREGKVVREKAAIVLPNSDYPKLDPNKTMPIQVTVDGFEETDDRADFKWRISALKVSE